MASGASRLRATKIVAGAIRAAAVRPSPRRFSATGPWTSAVSVIRLGSALEGLVPPVLERRIVLGHVGIVEIDEALLLLVGEADALLHVGRHGDVGDGGVVAHVDGEAFLRRWLHHGVEIGIGAGLVGRVLR